MTVRLIAALALAAVAGALFLAAGGDDDTARAYTVELDNAFGLVEGGDVRVAGVNAGRVESIDLDRRTKKALVNVEVTETGFGSFRSDVFCESRPQSPIGEYFLDCLPGTSKRELPPGSRVPVKQTTSTIAPDLIVNIMRRPYRERFRVILNEFGAGLAGRPQDLNDAIRRAVPALRQTDRLLAILADHNKVIRDLVEDADVVLKGLADNRRNVGKFVSEAADTSSASAERADDIATNFRKLPDFLGELRPTLAALGETVDEQRPALQDLSANAEGLERFFGNAARFSNVSRPAIRALGAAAVPGREAASAARPTVQELRRYAAPTTDLANNLAIVLEDFDDPSRAVEPDPRSPGGKGYAGTQALLRYVFSQSLAANPFDANGYMSRAAAFVDSCGPYADAAMGKDPKRAHCRSWLGPNQPGVTTPDPSGPRPETTERRTERRDARGRGHEDVAAPEPPARGEEAPAAPEGGSPPAPAPVEPRLERLLESVLKGLPTNPPTESPETHGLLDFLLSP